MFKKRITPFACIVISVLVCIVTCVGSAAILNNRHSAENNQLRQQTAGISGYIELINSMGDSADKYAKLSVLIDKLEQHYVNGYDESNLWDNIYKTLVMSIGDDYSRYFTAEEYNAMKSEDSGSFVGIGVHATFDVDAKGIYIFGVMPNSPAEKGGLLKGDIIVSADGVDATESNYYTMLDLIGGEAGTEVSLTVLRGEEKIDFTLIRSNIASENVIYEKLDDNVAYIRILSFSDETLTAQFTTAISKAQNDGCSRFIFDLRNNAGGFLEEICKTLDILLPEGPIINIVDKAGNITTRDSDANCIKAEKMVVLCNQSTASAAELFTAALRDYDLAEIVGVKTFGKGTMQTTYTLEDGSAIKMSTAFYNPPSNESYDGVGIIPDYEVKLDEKWESRFYKMPKEEDAQLQKAIELVTSTD
ncbi:MAG: S41 family peptidase [Ruminococcaceae bacterium]|nr:S41 family peptidase [Oscillospiraceae bacterium]